MAAWIRAGAKPEPILDLAATAAGTTSAISFATRLLDAPRELVWKTWNEPQHVAPWLGPNGFTTTVQEMTMRPGGTWRLVMHGPDGTDSIRTRASTSKS